MQASRHCTAIAATLATACIAIAGALLNTVAPVAGQELLRFESIAKHDPANATIAAAPTPRADAR